MKISLFVIHVVNWWIKCFLCLYLKRECQEVIDWYQSVKETQGSLEDTSFGQMRKIYSFGQYSVGSAEKKVSTSIAEVIHLTIEGTKETKSISKFHYTLDDLRDLESKLALITGRDVQERNEIDLFLKVR